MRLKSITIYGFKSFPDKVTLEFDRGITGIVGPNGCGKSNIVDAVLWVLGEQSPKKLRGKEMMDVIFNGTDSRKAVSWCEVTLVMDNEDGALEIEYPEVAITRRLYRSGESVYMMNGMECRLKDIRNLLLDTGLGVNAYALIEQGVIEQLVSTNPKQRRSVLEEAAGVSRYLARRHEALLKLERTSNNLARLEDIIKEVESRVRSLKRQASRARKYKELQEEIRDLKLLIARSRFGRLRNTLLEVNARIEELTARKEEIEGKLSETEEAIASVETQKMEVDRKLASMRQTVSRLAASIEAADDAVATREQQIRSLRQQIKSLEDQKRRLTERLEAMDEEEKQATARLEEIVRSLEREKSRLSTVKAAVEEVRTRHEHIRRAVEEKKAELVTLLQESAARQNRLGELSTRKEMLRARNRQLMEEMQRIRKRLLEEEERRRAVSIQRMRKKEVLQEDRDHLRDLMEESRRVNAEIDSLRKRLTEKETEAAAARSRMETLESLERSMEGVHEDIKDLRREVPDIPMLAEVIRVNDERMLPYVSEALGEMEQALIVEDTQQAVEIAGRAKGKLLLLVLDQLRQMPIPPSRADSLAEAVTPVKPEFQAVVDYLLGDVTIVGDVNEAMARWTDGERFVTADGIMVSRGRMTRNRTHRREAVSLLKRRLEIEQIENRLKKLTEERDRILESLRAATGRRDRLEKEISSVEERLAATGEEIRRMEHEIRRFDESRNRMEKELEEKGNEVSRLQTETTAAEAQEQALQREVDEIKDKIASVEEEIRTLSSRDEEISSRYKKHEEEAASLRVEIAQMEEAVKSLRSQVERLKRERAEHRENLHLCKVQTDECRSQVEDIRRHIDEIILSKEKNVLHVRETEEEMATLEPKRTDLDNRLSRMVEEERTLRERLRKTATDLQEEMLKKGRIEARIDEIENNVRNELGTSLRTEEQTVEEDDFDLEGTEERLKNLQTALARIGAVNMEAIEELQREEERLSFLAEQRNDLVEAKKDLERLIQEINKISKARLTETFKTVNEHFQQTFRKLFGGGKAELKIEEGVDILEAGVEITARPPGKDRQSISLLSGGEKALTAIAMLIALFKTHPSPFCILDEVDAPLDENNVGRFLALVKEMSEKTQFILITHNRKTMAAADTLYGVTMPEPGVSRVLSVRLAEAAAIAEA